MIPVLVVSLLASACSSSADDEQIIPESGVGHIRFNCSANPEIGEELTRAEAEEGRFKLPEDIIPKAGNFTLSISGSYTKNNSTYAWSWPTATPQGEEGESTGSGESTENVIEPKTVAAFHEENPDIEAGAYDAYEKRYLNSYIATITYGDPDAEGVGKAYFAGTSAPFSVYPGRTETVSFNARLANSCFTLQVTEWMLNYYDNIELTIHTATKEFTFELNDTTPSSLIFVKSGQQLSFSGTAVKSQTGTTVEFPEVAIGPTQIAAETHYAISVNHEAAGGGKLQITFGDEFTEVDPVEEELNPDVNGNGNSGGAGGDTGDNNEQDPEGEEGGDANEGDGGGENTGSGDNPSGGEGGDTHDQQ